MHLKKLFGLTLVFLCLTSGLFLIPSVNADGCVFIPTVEEWVMSYEEKQMALINYEDGIEELTIAVDIKNSSLNASQAFWIFPVPGKPKDASIDITKDVDFYLWGDEDIRDSVKDDIFSSIFFMTISQVYIAGVPIIAFYTNSMYLVASKDENINVYEHIEKMGITSELIHANTSESLDLYLEDKNITLPNESIEVINEYIGEDYSFVVSWISDLDTFKKEAYDDDFYGYYWGYQEPHYFFGLTVNFPSDDIYYPMKLTSIYGEKIIPILIQIDGHVTPKNSYNGMDTTYYKDYTEIEIKTESNDFTEDLLIKNQAPQSVQTASFISSNLLLISILIFILSSIFASLISTFIVYYKFKPDYWKFALIGLGNFLSIFFVFAICSVLKVSQNFVKKPVKEKNTSKNFILGFRITFLIIGLISIVMFFMIYVSFYFLFVLMSLLLVIGILMFIYGGIKSPKITLYTALFSIFFFMFLVIFSLMFNLILN